MKTAKRTIVRIALSIQLIVASSYGLLAQQTLNITGSVLEAETNEPIPFANVALYTSDGQTLIAGAGCNLNGEFILKANGNKIYQVTISAIGYQSVSREVELVSSNYIDMGITHLSEIAINLQSVTVVGKKVRGKSEADRSSYLVSSEMKLASTTGADVIKFIPGIQVDFMRNISLNGNRNILILVDGRERDMDFINQLNAQNIERIEVSQTPPARYEGSVSGVINIILTKENEKGADGHIFLEVPTSKNMVYIFPSYSLNYGAGKLNVYTSYNGEVTRLNQHETTKMETFDQIIDDRKEIVNNQLVTQNGWSHRFNFGFDYNINTKNQINLYAYHNRFSQEFNGEVETTAYGAKVWEATKEDDDKNINNFYSLYYKHSFNAASNHTVAFDISIQNFTSSKSTKFFSDTDGTVFNNSTNPQQDNLSFRVDYNLPINQNISVMLGGKGMVRELRNGTDFQYSEQQLSGYAEFSIKPSTKLDANFGLRFEESAVELGGGFATTSGNLLPTLSIGYRHSKKQNTRITYRKSVHYPSLYQLNPYSSQNNPFCVTTGNAKLEPSSLSSIVLEHGMRIKKGFINAAVFYSKRENAIDNLLRVDESGVFESKPYNLGNIQQLGIRSSGTISIASNVIINPSISIYNYRTQANGLALENLIKDDKGVGFRSSLSSLVTLVEGFSLSGIIQYYTPIANIQSSRFEDVTYFISVEKEFKRGLKVGVVSAIPFTKEFTYYGETVSSKDLYSHYAGKIEKSLVPLWFRITYQFATGKRKPNTQREYEDIEPMPRRGF